MVHIMIETTYDCVLLLGELPIYLYTKSAVVVKTNCMLSERVVFSLLYYLSKSNRDIFLM